MLALEIEILMSSATGRLASRREKFLSLTQRHAFSTDAHMASSFKKESQSFSLMKMILINSLKFTGRGGH